MARTKTKVLTSEEQEAQKEHGLQEELKNIRQKIETGRIPKNPTRLFKVGDRIQLGAWGHTVITEVLDGGMIYRLHADYMGQSYGKPVPVIQDAYYPWIDVFPYVSEEENILKEIFREKDDVRITYANNDIDSLLHKVYHAGVDFNPDYQRDLVWTPAQKNSLIDSIFNNVEIGKFTFIKHDYSREFFYEILDGKQRLTTLLEFYEDRFEYRGKKFSEMSFADKHQFTGFHIVQGEVENLTQKQIYKLFK